MSAKVKRIKRLIDALEAEELHELNVLLEGTWVFSEKRIPELRNAIKNMETVKDYKSVEDKALLILGDDKFLDELSILEDEVTEKSKQKVLSFLDKRVEELR